MPASVPWNHAQRVLRARLASSEFIRVEGRLATLCLGADVHRFAVADVVQVVTGPGC